MDGCRFRQDFFRQIGMLARCHATRLRTDGIRGFRGIKVSRSGLVRADWHCMFVRIADGRR
jgi:hypothetical protein